VALPTAYLTSTRNLDGILSAIQTAQAPQRFTLNFLENLGYKSSSDRLIINVLKAVGFLSADGAPTERYYRFLDQTEAGKVLAEGLQDAYADLYQLSRIRHGITARASLRYLRLQLHSHEGWPSRNPRRRPVAGISLPRQVVSAPP
jgi:hypothetical protein